MVRAAAFGALLALLALGGCARSRGEMRLSVKTLEAPAAPGSGEPNLAVAPNGRVLLSWIEPTGENQHSLLYAIRSKGGGWSKPETIASGRGWFVNWAEFPSLATLPDGALFAHWLVKSGADTYAYEVRVASSRDGGKSWSAPSFPTGMSRRPSTDSFP